MLSEFKHCITKLSVFVERASLNLISGLGMARAVSRESLTAEALVHLLTSPCEIGTGRSGIGTLFSPVTLDSLLSLSLHKSSTLIGPSVTDAVLS